MRHMRATSAASDTSARTAIARPPVARISSTTWSSAATSAQPLTMTAAPSSARKWDGAADIPASTADQRDLAFERFHHGFHL
jgi:hypothetical protein